MEEHRVITTSTQTQNQKNTKTNSSKIREEGELSASENDEAAGSGLRGSTVLPAVPFNRDTSVAETGRFWYPFKFWYRSTGTPALLRQ
ncbi:hypothetical protein Tco_0211761, partial [Tanacetum coccineum]